MGLFLSTCDEKNKTKDDFSVFPGVQVQGQHHLTLGSLYIQVQDQKISNSVSGTGLPTQARRKRPLNLHSWMHAVFSSHRM